MILISNYGLFNIKFTYSEKATKFCEIFTLLLTTVHTLKSKVKILQNFVAFSEYMNFMKMVFSSGIVKNVLKVTGLDLAT